MTICSCGHELEPECTYFISDIGKDLLLECPSCGAKFEVEHECEEEGCYEYVYPIETKANSTDPS